MTDSYQILLQWILAQNKGSNWFFKFYPFPNKRHQSAKKVFYFLYVQCSFSTNFDDFFCIQSNLSIVVTWGRLTKWPLYTGDLYMNGFDYSTKYSTLVVNKLFNYMLCFVCYFVPVVMLLLFTFIVNEIISIWYVLNKTYK